MGAAGGLAVGKAVTGMLFSEANGGGNTPRLQRRLDEHRQKLEDYKRDPDAFDNQGRLRDATDDAMRNRIIEGRIRHLENEIRAFEKGIREAGQTPR